jgi:hypothetical protein
MKRAWLLLLLAILVPMLVACGNGDDDDNDAPEDVDALLTAAADELDNAASFQFVLRQSGAPTRFEFEGFEMVDITLNDATATFVSPNAVQAELSVSLDASTQKAEIIGVDNRQYFQQSLITGGNWEELTLVPDFQPADLQSEDAGIGSALRSMENAEFIGNEERDGIRVHHIRGQVPAERLNSVTVGLMATTTGMITTDVYIRRDETNRVAFIELQEPSPPEAEEDLSKTWEIEFRGYNQNYVINEPETGDAS